MIQCKYGCFLSFLEGRLLVSCPVQCAVCAGAALKHFEQTGNKYPLVVKLGTITPHSADVYSYAPDEDDMVLDPLLKAHLAHWGINMMEMEKTDKTMAELQVRTSSQCTRQCTWFYTACALSIVQWCADRHEHQV